MKKEHHRRQVKRQDDALQGQAIIILAFGIVGLIAMVGFAIDGGRLYSIRRQAQNAADAAAIAGARELAELVSNCASTTSTDRASYNVNVVGRKVADFAANNGVHYGTVNGDVKGWYVDQNIARMTTENTVGVSGYTVPLGAVGVEVHTTLTETTTFMRFFGQRFVIGVGEATAITGPVVQFGGGVLPIAVPEIALNGLGKGTPFYVFDKKGVFCREHDDHCFGSENDPASQRGWLHLGHIYNAAHWESDDPMDRTYSYNFGAGSEACSYHDNGSIDVVQTRMNAWAAGSCAYPYPIFRGDPDTLGGDFIAGLTGAKASGLKAVANQIGNTVYLPVFDNVYYPDWMNSTFADKTPDGGFVTGGAKVYYHIIGYVAVDLTDVSGGKIEGEFRSVVIGAGKIQPGAGLGSCNDFELYGVKLWE